MRLGWFLVFLPVILGLVAGFAARDWLQHYILQVSLDNVVWIVGPILSIVAIVAGALWKIGNMSRELSEAGDRHQRFLKRLEHDVLKRYVQDIQSGLGKVDEVPSAEALNLVRHDVQRLSKFAADLRVLIDLETCPIERSPVDLGEILTDAVEDTRKQPEVTKRCLKLGLYLPHAPRPLPNVEGDPELLFRAIRNLLDNAVKFTQSNGSIEVRAFEDRDTVVIEVADTGIGIPNEEQLQVWEELYRGSGATHHHIPGSGLGLAMVRAIIKQHRGQIELRSEGEDKGTCMTVRLPTRGITS